MKMFIIGFLTCYVILCLISFMEDYVDGFDWEVTDFLMRPVTALALPIVWLAMWPIHFFRNVVRPTSKRNFVVFQNTIDPEEKTRHLFKNIYLHHDPFARHKFARWFLVRVKG